MNKLLTFTFLLVTLSGAVYAQKVVKRDTINIRGYIYDADGKPARVYLLSKSYSLSIEGKHIDALSDSTGFFHMEGLNPVDTISILTFQYVPPIILNGSRYVQVTLPQFRPKTLNPINVEAARTKTRELQTFNIIKPESKYSFFPDFESPVDYPGGLDKLQKLVAKQITYPQKAIDNNIEGTIEIAFLINKKGNMTDFKIVRGLGYGCDEEVINALKKIPKWKPAVYYGHPLNTPGTVSINFKLTDK
ncbi:TonB family protein [Mucilaginibacter sp. KACC 22063]|uniref:TonB family protein n=1 Tax=Mucilaginibacter sp. KACC 22063 TaxID=3025666 RepID=UPI0023659CD5|nr:TonB family protein [Mucilaginibacter sp. KACC 22063]WDF56365.1 TonB family protein [Mucilaginibacter sp. KACC 22063]